MKRASAKSGAANPCAPPIPDFASLHPGYDDAATCVHKGHLWGGTSSMGEMSHMGTCSPDERASAKSGAANHGGTAHPRFRFAMRTTMTTPPMIANAPMERDVIYERDVVARAYPQARCLYRTSSTLMTSMESMVL